MSPGRPAVADRPLAASGLPLDKALQLFEDHGTLVVDDDVLMIEGDNKPGSLAKLANKLSVGKVNIEYAYCATPPDAKKGLLILRVSDAKKAMKILNS